jgi:hypothetical protein
MNGLPRLLRPLLWLTLILMAIIAVLAFRSGEPAFSALAATWVLYSAFLLRFGLVRQRGAVRVAGVAIAVLMIIFAVGTLIF